MTTQMGLEEAVRERGAAFAACHPGARWLLETDNDEATRLAIISADFQGIPHASRYNMVVEHLEELPEDVRDRLADIRLLTHFEWVREPEQVVLTGVDPNTGNQVDVTVGDLSALMHFEYDEEHDVLTMRLKSFAGEPVEEPAEDDFVLLRGSKGGPPVGMRVPNYSRRFAVQMTDRDPFDVGFIAPIVRSFLSRAA